MRFVLGCTALILSGCMTFDGVTLGRLPDEREHDSGPAPDAASSNTATDRVDAGSSDDATVIRPPDASGDARAQDAEPDEDEEDNESP